MEASASVCVRASPTLHLQTGFLQIEYQNCQGAADSADTEASFQNHIFKFFLHRRHRRSTCLASAF